MSSSGAAEPATRIPVPRMAAASRGVAPRRKRARTRPQRCCCGKDDGICAGDNVKEKGVGLRMPFGAPGSLQYESRATLLRQLGVVFDPEGSGGDRTFEKMMAVRDLRVSVKHFPGDRTDVISSGRHKGKRTLRVQSRGALPPSKPIDTMMEDVDAARAMPSQSMATRSARKTLDSAVQPQPQPRRPRTPATPTHIPRVRGAAGGRMSSGAGDQLASEMASAVQREIALTRELQAQKAEVGALSSTIDRQKKELAEERARIARIERRAKDFQSQLKEQDAKYTKELAKLRRELDKGGVGFQPLRASMLHGSLSKRVRQFTHFPSAEAFDAFVACLDAGDLLSSIRTKPKRVAAADGSGSGDESDESDGSSEPALLPTRRKLSPADAVFMVLMRLKTGLDLIDLHALFGVGYSTACSYFVMYVSFLREWLEVEFPPPTEAQILAAMPASFKAAFPDRNVQLIIDAHEQQCEEPSNLVCRRSVWSDYKHRTTNKFLGACTPAGACVFVSDNYGGKTDDKTLTLASGLMELLFPGWVTLADKGFMMHAEVRPPPPPPSPSPFTSYAWGNMGALRAARSLPRRSTGS